MWVRLAENVLICLLLGGLLLAGLSGFFWITNRSPASMTITALQREGTSAKWLEITGAKLDLRNAFVARPDTPPGGFGTDDRLYLAMGTGEPGASYPALLMLEGSPTIARVKRAQAAGELDGKSPLFVALHEELAAIPLRGKVRSLPAGARRYLQMIYGPGLKQDFLVIEAGKKPGLFGFWLGAGTVFVSLMLFARLKPAPKVIAVGAPEPPPVPGAAVVPSSSPSPPPLPSLRNSSHPASVPAPPGGNLVPGLMARRIDMEAVGEITLAELEDAVARGARFVGFPKCLSLFLWTSKWTHTRYFPPGATASGDAWRAALVSGIFGWWAIPLGPVYTVAALLACARGGYDVTRDVMSGYLGEARAAQLLAHRPPAVPDTGMKALRAAVGLLIGLPFVACFGLLVWALVK